MTELSGSLEGVGLATVVRFLADLQSTGVLRVSRGDANGEVAFRRGQVVAASFGAVWGVEAIEWMALSLANGRFVYSDGDVVGSAAISLGREEVLHRLEALVGAMGPDAVLAANGVPYLVEQSEPEAAAGGVLLDRATLRLLLAVDGRRTVYEIARGRDLVETHHQLHSLLRAGLIGIAARHTWPEPAPPAAGPGSDTDLDEPLADVSPLEPPRPSLLAAVRAGHISDAALDDETAEVAFADWEQPAERPLRLPEPRGSDRRSVAAAMPSAAVGSRRNGTWAILWGRYRLATCLIAAVLALAVAAFVIAALVLDRPVGEPLPADSPADGGQVVPAPLAALAASLVADGEFGILEAPRGGGRGSASPWHTPAT